MAGLLTAFVAGNNQSAAVGTIIGSRTVSVRFGTIISIFGFAGGLLVQGALLARVSGALMPHSQYLAMLAFFASFVIFLAATILRTPLSLTMALVGVATGISIRVSYPIYYPYLESLVIVWIFAPVLVIGFSMIASRGIDRIQVKDTWRAASFSKISLIIVSFFTAFTLGANTLGLILAIAGPSLLAYASMIVGIVLGCLFIGSGTIKRVGEDIYSLRYSSALVSQLVSSIGVEVATLLGIPLSNTQTLTSSVVGTGLSRRYKFIHMRPFFVVVAMWIISPLTGLALGYAI